MKKAIVFAVLAGGFAMAAPALAGTSDQLDLCVAALDEGNELSASDYEPRFKSIRGGGLKRLSFELRPLDGAGEPIEAECKIRRGQVVDVTIKA